MMFLMKSPKKTAYLRGVSLLFCLCLHATVVNAQPGHGTWSWAWYANTADVLVEATAAPTPQNFTNNSSPIVDDTAEEVDQHLILKVVAKHGRIVVEPPMDCRITVNGTTFDLFMNDTEGFHFGLVQYNCGGIEGEIHSHPNCINCGVFCPVNERIVGCSSHTFLKVVGVIVGVVCGLITVVIVMKYRVKCANCVKNRNEQKEIKRKKQLIQTIRSLNHDDQAEFFTATGVDCSNVSTGCRSPTTFTASSSPSISSLSLALCLILAVACKSVAACDMTVYITSQLTVCTENSCHQFSGYTFPLGVGSTVCFNVGEDTAFKVTLEETYVWTVYEIQYYTQEFSIETETTWNCMGSRQGNLSCWTDGCRANVKHPDFNPKSKIDVYNCKWSSSTCSGLGCTHGSKCVWYHWWIAPKGNLYPVYSQVLEYWNSTFLIESSHGNSRVHVSNAQPSYIPTDALFSQIMFTVSSMSHPRHFLPKNVIRIDGDLVGVDACSLDTPVLGMIGEFQVALNQKSWRFPTASINCQINNCGLGCLTNGQALSNLKLRKRPQEVYSFTVSSNNEVAIIQGVQSTATVVLGNIKIKNMIFKFADCRFRVTKVYGCMSCDLLPYVVVTPYAVKEYGTAYFESDCPFLQNTLACGRLSTILNLRRSDVTKCNIYIPSTNQTLNFTVTLDFVGEMSDNALIYYGNNDPYETFKTVLSSPNFLNTALYSYLGISLLGVVFTALSMIARICATVLAERRVNRDIELNLRN